MNVVIRKSQLGDVRRITVGVLHSPAAVRHVPRLIGTLGKSTLEMRQPWLPFEVTEMLASRLGDTAVVFEFGGGGSTAWFSDHAASVTTVEHDPEWYGMLDAELGHAANVTLIHRPPDPDFDGYVHAIDAYADQSFDVVVVDGRQRVRCFERAIGKVRPGGLLLLDDVERAWYKKAFTLVDWPRYVVRDFAPCKPTLGYTAVFHRPDVASD